ncbi:MAG: FAD-dependent oxidoreductase [Gammaproteobacteria bacterium]|nr:FAD-dependent oxidoreductase [Gammaproteobacteria bacterium]
MNRRRFLAGSTAAAVMAAIYSGQAGAAALRALFQVTSNVDAVTGDGARVVLEKAALQELSDSLRGNLLVTGSDGYDVARRVLNKSIDKYPALIVQPTGVADIRNAVTFARERNLLLAVKCGGHSFSGKSTCDGGMQIDLSTFRNARVDPVAKKAYVAGGSLLGELDHECMAHGLVTTAGTVSHTGVGGLTLGGGFGRVARRYGLALDNLTAVDIVTADGRLRHASADENPDLFWGVRGGGGNFGIVTSFEFALHEMQREVIGGNMIWPLSQAKDVLKFYAEYCEQAPDDLYMDFILFSPPGGVDPAVIVHTCYSGPARNADRVLGPLTGFGKPLANQVAPIDYVALQRSGDDSDPRSAGQYLKSGFNEGISDELMRALIEGFEPHPDRATVQFFQQSGGAIGRVPSDATAFAQRWATHSVFTTVQWEPDVDRGPHVDYVRRWWDDVEPSTRGFYTNEIADEAQQFINSNYEGNFNRLLSIKKEYDPGNLFRLNANVRPA